MTWFADAPSNIALIKYMGKKDVALNIPSNPSLSYTLTNLVSTVTLESIPGKKDFWEPLNAPGAAPFTLSARAQERYLKHLVYLKTYFNYQGAFIVRSNNNFPLGSGLASSASSFAALTKCANIAICAITSAEIPSVEIQAGLSRIGSGSSCRSFFAPWALWDETHVSSLDLPYTNLLHEAIIVSHEEKHVSSSEAHIRIKSSPLYDTRTTRAVNNLKQLIDALKLQDWETAYRVCWREFQDLHQLFATCANPFTYMNERTNTALQLIQDLWLRQGDGPLVTMDAGPNIHLLYRPDQKDVATKFKQDYLVNQYDFL